MLTRPTEPVLARTRQVVAVLVGPSGATVPEAVGVVGVALAPVLGAEGLAASASDFASEVRSLNEHCRGHHPFGRRPRRRIHVNNAFAPTTPSRTHPRRQRPRQNHAAASTRRAELTAHPRPPAPRQDPTPEDLRRVKEALAAGLEGHEGGLSDTRVLLGPERLEAEVGVLAWANGLHWLPRPAFTPRTGHAQEKGRLEVGVWGPQ